jgi:hypothetical protein
MLKFTKWVEKLFLLNTMFYNKIDVTGGHVECKYYDNTRYSNRKTN